MTSFQILRSVVFNTLNRIFTINFSGVSYAFAFAWFVAICFFIGRIKK